MFLTDVFFFFPLNFNTQICLDLESYWALNGFRKLISSFPQKTDSSCWQSFPSEQMGKRFSSRNNFGREEKKLYACSAKNMKTGMFCSSGADADEAPPTHVPHVHLGCFCVGVELKLSS